MPLRFLLLSAVLLAAGCATPPEVDRDIASALESASHSPGGLAGMRIEGEKLARSPFVAGNTVMLLRDGTATYAAMADAIRSAKYRVDMESYQFDEDEGAKFADLLLAKRAEGAEVNLIYDAWGSFETSAALFDRLRQGGVSVVEYNPFDPTAKVPLDLNRRDHRKLIVVDDRIVLVGGVNISEVYDKKGKTARTDPDAMAWRDTDVRIEGPVAAEFDRMFLETWTQQKGPPLAPFQVPQPPASQMPGHGDTAVQPGIHVETGALVQAIDGAPDDSRPMIYRTLVVAIALAKTSIHLTTGFFVPTPDLTREIELAARRGVDVELVVPAYSDSSIAVAAGRASYHDLLDAGVRIFEREGAVLHAKTAVIDGGWATIGSSNLDWRSVLYNNEIDAVILDPGFGRNMEAMFRDDLAKSHEIDRKTWADRPLGERLGEWQARLFGNLL